jgi:hypothetical protein
MKIDNIKEEVNHDMENLRKKNETETQNIMEGYSSRLEQQKAESQNMKIKHLKVVDVPTAEELIH